MQTKDILYIWVMRPDYFLSK